MDYKWMPIFGEFDTSSPRIVFKGKEIRPTTSGEPQAPQQPTAAVGLLLSNQRMLNGCLRAKVMFQGVTPHSVCEVIVGFDPKTKGQISAGLGGSFAMFSIREWTPAQTQKGSSWVNHELSGDRSNLKEGVEYELAARLQGSALNLEVDGVQVASATLPSSLNQPRQVGIFCVNLSEITITDFVAEIERPKAFIVMQFSSPYNEVYSHVIKDVCDEFGVEAVRADEIYGPGIIIKDVID